MGQPDVGGVHAVDSHGLSGEIQEGTYFLYHHDSSSVHDGCLHDLHLRGEDRAGTPYHLELCDRAIHICGIFAGVLHIVFQTRKIKAQSRNDDVPDITR